MSPFLRSALRGLIDLAAIGAALIFIGGYFPTSLMFADTTASGGDMGTHYYALDFLRHELLPKGQVTGWCPGNYCGFPLFQMYFPLPFFLMAVLSYLAVPLTVAFKLGTVLGTFLLPITSYLALRFARVPFPGPALGAFAPLPFIFMQDNSMWGGNIPSTLAGEFSLSLGLSLAVLFLGSLRYTMATGRGAVWNGALVALIGLAHGYTLLWGGLSSLVELFTLRGWWRRVGTLITVHGLAILLMGAWFVPLVGYGAWTTAYNHSWPLKSWQEALPGILQPAAMIAVGAAVLEALLALWERRPFSRALATFWGATIIGVLFWKVAHVFHVVDIRFVPFAQLGICLTAAAGVGVVLGRLPLPEIWPFVGAILVLPFVEHRVTFIPSWVKWNYSGFEQKATWPVLKQLSEKLKGTYQDPRIVYEHSPDHEALGTVRAFENLPFFTGRGTLEGLYMQGSPTAPFVFYIQSEISKDISCPFPDYGCARFDIDRGLGHLYMFNVSDWIVRSDKVKAAAAAHPDLELTTTVGQYQIFHLKKADGHYAVPLQWQPSLVREAKWKEAAYRWFKRVGPNDPLPVFAADATAAEAKLFAGDFPAIPKEMPAIALPNPPLLREVVAADRIVVTGTRPGHPIVVRISYHPRWVARTGEKVWLVGPSFMLLFPKGEEVVLEYDGGGPVTLGNLFTIVGLLIVAGSLCPPVRRRAAAVWTGVLAAPGIGPITGWVRDPLVWTSGRRRLLLGGALSLVATGFAWGILHSDSANSESVYREAQRLYDAGKLKEAAVQFHRVTELTPLSATAIHSHYFEAICAFREERWADALPVFERLVEGFPEGINAPEALYHVGLCKLHLNDRAGAKVAWEQVKARYPDATWAKYSQDRLKRALAVKVVFHADDFGLTPGINAGIIEAHEQGVLGSASLMVTADAALDAVARAAAHPTLDLGLHLTLVAERPVAPPEEIQSLLDGDRFWRHHPTVALRYLRGQWNPSHAVRELAAQWERCVRLGVTPSHCDGHQHLHLLPAVFPSVVGQARQHGVAFVRSWLSDPWRTPGRLARRGVALAMAGVCWWSWSRVGNRSGIRLFPTIGFIGAGGGLTVDGVMAALEQLRRRRQPPEIVEVMLHPGRRDAVAAEQYGHWGYDWENDLAVLCDRRLRAWLPERGYDVTSFRALASNG